jgi:hypothetical protein
MSDSRFEVEQNIMDCWNVVDDIKTIFHSESLYTNEDEMQNVLLGLFSLYQLKFDKLFKSYEQLLQDFAPSKKTCKCNRFFSLVEEDEE